MIKGVLLDLGGVVYVGDAPLNGAVEAIGRLRTAGLAVRFVTNITRQSRRALLEALAVMGIKIRGDELFMPTVAARDYLVKHALKPHLLVAPGTEEDFRDIPKSGSPAVVIGDAGEAFEYTALNRAFRLLVKGAPLIALAKNRVFRDFDGELSLDAGAFVTALEYASGREAIVLGKPAADFFLSAVAGIGCAPSEAVMVGDDAESDVAGAVKAGLMGVLVKTGKYRPGDENGIDPPPTAVSDDLPAATDWILTHMA